jgi:putative PIN family toxin of toxin-antitoxin system
MGRAATTTVRSGWRQWTEGEARAVLTALARSGESAAAFARSRGFSTQRILVSAALKPDGLQRTVLLLALSKPAMLYVSEPILAEYRNVLARPELRIRKGVRQQLLQLIANRARSVTPTRVLQVARDPDDNKFLECADTARADYLVTGNQRHFPEFWKKTKVITSREFVSIVAPHLT